MFPFMKIIDIVYIYMYIYITSSLLWWVSAFGHQSKGMCIMAYSQHNAKNHPASQTSKAAQDERFLVWKWLLLHNII